MLSQSQPLVGFSREAFSFLEELSKNQSRDWFQSRKGDYERYLREPLAALVSALAHELPSKGVPLYGDPKKSIFRINRDIRFSENKNPYKTHVSAALTRSGDKQAPGLLYVHVAPVGSFVACGFYQPESTVLYAIRKRIAGHPKEIVAIKNALRKKSLELRDDESLRRNPRGFDTVTDSEVSALLRMKSLIVSKPLSRSLLANGEELLEAIIEFCTTTGPLLHFGWKSLDGQQNDSQSSFRA